MTLLPRLCLLLALGGLLAACQIGTAARGPDDVTPNAVTGDAIEVTPLDAPSAAPAPATAEALPAAPAQGAPPAAGPAEPEALPAPVPGSEDGAGASEGAGKPGGEAAAADAALETAAPAAAPKSPSQIACERKRGSWVNAGSGLNTCVFPTRDGGERCTRESQCDGVCLARSGTCSPVKPLLGCNEILQDNGARVTLCIE